MKSTDCVELVIVTHHNFIRVSGFTWKDASNYIRGWYEYRDRAMKTGESDKWLLQGTMAINRHASDMSGETSLAESAVAVEHVIGMYIQPSRGLSWQERYTQAMEKFTDVAVKEVNRGEDWKGVRNEPRRPRLLDRAVSAWIHRCALPAEACK